MLTSPTTHLPPERITVNSSSWRGRTEGQEKGERDHLTLLLFFEPCTSITIIT